MVFPGLEGCKSAPFHVSFRQDLREPEPGWSKAFQLLSAPHHIFSYFFLSGPLGVGMSEVRVPELRLVGGLSPTLRAPGGSLRPDRGVSEPHPETDPPQSRMASGRQSWAVSSPQWVSSCNMGTACVGMRSLGSRPLLVSAVASGRSKTAPSL